MKRLDFSTGIIAALISLTSVAQALPASVDYIDYAIKKPLCSKQLEICQSSLDATTQELNSCLSNNAILQAAYDQLALDLTEAQAALGTLQGFYTVNLNELAQCASNLQIANDKGAAASAELEALKSQGSKSFYSLAGCFKSLVSRTKRGLPTGKLLKKCKLANQSNLDLAANLQGLGVQIAIQTKVK